MKCSAGKNDGTDFEYFCCASIRHVLLVFSICFVLFRSRCRYHDVNDHEKSRADRNLPCSQDQAEMSSNVFCFAVEYAHDLHRKWISWIQHHEVQEQTTVAKAHIKSIIQRRNILARNNERSTVEKRYAHVTL